MLLSQFAVFDAAFELQRLSVVSDAFDTAATSIASGLNTAASDLNAATGNT